MIFYHSTSKSFTLRVSDALLGDKAAAYGRQSFQVLPEIKSPSQCFLFLMAMCGRLVGGKEMFL